ncbi:12138_t:CDS:10 [Entrophospora sp. SA101]|nr:12138_t:CDS:10 [Entrophospora sp. SA101]CAJ0910232.1 2005_t:CDS:10 [Entrophospora sp. SA101]
MSQQTKNKNDGGGHSQKTNYGQKKISKKRATFLGEDEEKKNDSFDQFSGLVDSKRNNGENDNNNNKDNDDKKYSSKLENRNKKREIKRTKKWAISSSKENKSEKYGDTLYTFMWNKKGFQILGEVQLGKRTLEILVVTSSSHEIQINLDIPRTTRSHIMFISEDSAGQKSLFNILKAFSNHDQQVGYCQGMASVAAILLIYYLEEKKNEIRTATYATRWYLTLFTSEVVPHHTLLRFWDLLMLYGFDISYYIAVGLLKYNKYKLINFDFDDTMLKKTA